MINELFSTPFCVRMTTPEWRLLFCCPGQRLDCIRDWTILETTVRGGWFLLTRDLAFAGLNWNCSNTYGVNAGQPQSNYAFNMLLTDSNPLYKLGMRPRAVTTPVRVRSQSGTWDETSTHAENLSPNPRPTPTQTATKNAHYFSTVHIPRLRECAFFFWFDAL